MQPIAINDSPPAASLAGGAASSIASRLLPPLLVAASVAVDLVVYVLHNPQAGFPTVIAITYVALALSQMSLVTIWASLARADRLVRLLGAASAILLLAIGLLHFEPRSEQWIVLIGIHLVALAAPLRLADVALDRRPDQLDAAADLQQVQFTLKHLFLATTALAVLLGLLRATEFALREMVTFCSFGLLMAAIGWIAVWGVFGNAKPLARGAAIVTFGPLAGAGIAWLLTGRPGHAAAHATLCFVQSLMLAGSLWVLRLSGYRLRAFTAASDEGRIENRG